MFTSSSQPVPWRALLSGLIAQAAHRDQPCQSGRRGQSGSMAFWEVRFSLVGLFPLCHLRGEGGGPAIATARSPSLCEGRTQKASRRRKQEQKREEGEGKGMKETRKD